MSSRRDVNNFRVLYYLNFKARMVYTNMRISLSQPRESRSTPFLHRKNLLRHRALERANDCINTAWFSAEGDVPYLEYLAQEFPTGEFGNWTRCQELLSQAYIAYNSIPVTLKSWEAWAQIVTNVAWYLWRKGDYEKAREMITEALAVREQILELNDSRTLVSVEVLAGILLSQRNYEKAVATHKRALKGFKETLGSLHPFTLTSISNLALALQHLGRHQDSQRLNSLALRGSQLVMGSHHTDTLTSMGNLALVLQHQGKYKRAKRLNQESLDGFREILGKQHPLTLTSMSNLAVVLQCQRRYEESEELQQISLRGKVEELGWDHPSTLIGIDRLVSVLQCQSKWAELEQLHRRCEKDMETITCRPSSKV